MLTLVEKSFNYAVFRATYPQKPRLIHKNGHFFTETLAQQGYYNIFVELTFF